MGGPVSPHLNEIEQDPKNISDVVFASPMLFILLIMSYTNRIASIHI